MRKVVSIIFLLVFLAGCKDKNKIPATILPPEKMQQVLWDMLRADELVSTYIARKDSAFDKKIESTALYEKIFLLHHTSRQRFSESLSFYRSHPDMLKAMMDSLVKKADAIAVTPANPIPIKDTSHIKVNKLPAQ